MEDELSVDDECELRVIGYDAGRDAPCVSMKRVSRNDFEALQQVRGLGDVVECKVVGVRAPLVRLEIHDGDVVACAYLHKAQVSNFVFVSDELLDTLFRSDQVFPCVIRSIDARSRMIEVSRRMFFESMFETLEYGNPQEVTIIKDKDRRRLVGYGNRVEGTIVGAIRGKLAEGDQIQVLLAKKGKSARDVEVVEEEDGR